MEVNQCCHADWNDLATRRVLRIARESSEPRWGSVLPRGPAYWQRRETSAPHEFGEYWCSGYRLADNRPKLTHLGLDRLGFLAEDLEDQPCVVGQSRGTGGPLFLQVHHRRDLFEDRIGVMFGCEQQDVGEHIERAHDPH